MKDPAWIYVVGGIAAGVALIAIGIRFHALCTPGYCYFAASIPRWFW